jgi:DNA-binding response OmpR family regulator
LGTTGKKIKILLLEDDIDLGETIEEILEDEGYSVVWVKDGIEASDATYSHKFDLYIFDINVPEFNGLELLEALRGADDKTHTIFISALVDLDTISQAFDIGAEDYIKKPFFPEELLIRVKAKFNIYNRDIYYKSIRYNPKTSQIYKDDKSIQLSRMQLELFDFFIRNIDRVIDRDRILEETSIKSISALRVAITKLKQKTGFNIKNVHGVGYILEES